jgi:hypothetical protein
MFTEKSDCKKKNLPSVGKLMNVKEGEGELMRERAGEKL